MCSGAEVELAQAWNEDSQAKAKAGLMAAIAPGTDGAWLADSWAKTQALLDDYGRAWVEMSTDACEATWVRGEQSARLLGQRNECLDRRRAEVGALVEILAQATPEVAPHAFSAAASLSPLSRCADSEALAAAVDPPETEQTTAEVAELRRELARAQVLDATGLHAQAEALAEQLHQKAKTLGYDPVEAEARFHLGRIKASLAKSKDAEKHLSEAHWKASSVKHDTIAAAAASALVDVVGIDLARRDEGVGWARHAEAAFKRIGLGGIDEAMLRHRVGATHAANRSWTEAQTALEQARALYEKQPRRALALTRVLRDLATVRIGLGDPTGADELLAQALSLTTETAGERHPEVAAVMLAQGRVDDARGDPRTARAHYEAALALLESTVGSASPLVAEVYEDLARSHVLAEEHDQATAMQQRAHELLREALGEHPKVARALYTLGTMRHAAGRREDARRDWDQALALWETTRGKDHPDLAYPLTRLAALDLEDGQAKQAVERLERALKVRGRKGLTPSLLADTQFALAQALHKSGEDRTRARELAQKARKTYAEAGPGEHDVAAVDRWLATVGNDELEDP